MSILIVMLLLVVALLVYAVMTSKESKVEVDTKEGSLVDVKDVCPACGHALKEDDLECPGCGLHF